MHILIANNTRIPAIEYGGTERVIWWLGKELARLGHQVTYLVAPGSRCPFAEVLPYDPAVPLNAQFPGGLDVVHLNFQTREALKKPYLITHHGNYHPEKDFNINTVFVSRNHAQRNGSKCFVHNGVDPEEYGPVDFSSPKKYLLFLAWASRPEKNLRDCLYIARKTKNVLAVLGGKDRWFRRRPWVEYKGFIGGEEKNAYLRSAKALVFPVRWHEPCAITILESLYFGLPVLGTTYGCLPELVPSFAGFLSNSRSELARAAEHLDAYNRRQIHDYAMENFSAQRMTRDYLSLYAKVLNGEKLNPSPPLRGENFSREQLLAIYP